MSEAGLQEAEIQQVGRCALFGSPSNDGEKVEKLSKRGEKLLRRYKRAIRTGSDSSKEQLDTLLSSYAFKVLAVNEANKKPGIRNKMLPVEILFEAKRLNWEAPLSTEERVMVWPKSSGGVRVCYDFGFRRRAVFEGLAMILKQQFEPRSFQYDVRGIHDAIRDVRKKIEAGYCYVAHKDIIGHFANFDGEKLASELSLPQRAVDLWVMADAIPIGQIVGRHKVPSVSKADLHTLAHQGIPAGSCLSAVVATLIGSKLEWNAPANVFLLCFVDNQLALAKDETSLEKASDALSSAVAALPGGHFSLQQKEGNHADSGFDFLGHHIQRIGGAVRIKPSAANETGFYKKVLEYDEQLDACMNPHSKHLDQQTKAAALRILGRAWTYITSWGRAFQECDEIDEYVTMALLPWKPFLAALEVSVEDLKHFEDPTAAWVFAELS